MLSSRLWRKAASESMLNKSARTFSAALTSVPDVTLYNYHICPFCSIPKALMNYANIDYKAIEVNPLTKAEIKFSKEYRKVPIAIIDGDQINGSKEITDLLLANSKVIDNIAAKNDLTIEEFTNSDHAQQWEAFAKDELGAIMYPNICSSLGKSFEAFGYVKNVDEFTGVQKAMIRGVGSLAMYFAASKIKSKRNITDEREALNEALTKWEEEGMNHDQIDMGHLAMYAVMKSISDLSTHKEAVVDRGGPLLEWYMHMNHEVSK